MAKNKKSKKKTPWKKHVSKNKGQNLKKYFKGENIDRQEPATEQDTRNDTSEFQPILMCSPNRNENDIQDEDQCDSPLQLPELILESAKDAPKKIQKSRPLGGNRVADLIFYRKQLQQFAKHGVMNCGIDYLTEEKETSYGLRSCITMRCEMCNYEKKVWTQRGQSNKIGSDLDINEAAVVTTICSGLSLQMYNDHLVGLNIPAMSSATYYRYHSKLDGLFYDACLEQMLAAGKEEKAIAEEKGHFVYVKGKKFHSIAVKVDGSWLRRSYKGNYASLLGTAIIVGAETGKVLFVGVRSKYCTICHIVRRKLQQLENLYPDDEDEEEKSAAAEVIKNDYKNHKCTKNWGSDQSSGSMEASIIAEGFDCSMEMHGLVYKKYCGDGDSSTKKALVVARPYPGIIIEKFECKNHLWRAFNGHMKTLTTAPSKTFSPALRRLVASRILRLRRKVNRCVKFRNEQNTTKEQKSIALKEDIVTSLHCTFGDHSKCDKNNSDLCSEKDRAYPKNHVDELKSSTMWDKILDYLLRLINNSRSLVENMDSNIVECVNALIAKFCLNKSKLIPRTYRDRIYAAIISFNTGGKVLQTLIRKASNQTPGTHIKNMESMKIKKNRPENPNSRKRLFRTPIVGQDKHYGPNCATLPLEGEELESAKNDFLSLFKMSPQDIAKLERETREQAESELWHRKRGNMLTASNHGEVCIRQPTTLCQKLVMRLLYPTKKSNIPSIEFGTKNEPKAKELLSKKLNIVIDKAGLFCCQKYQFLGGTPDGSVAATNQSVEIKCSYSARNMTPEEGILAKKITCWKHSNKGTDEPPKFEFNKNHEYYYQIQSQLHYSNKQECIFAVYTEKEPFIKYEIIQRDEKFYKEKMEGKLVQFYMKCMLPELVDPMKKKGLNIREPKHILDAIAEQEKAKAAKLLAIGVGKEKAQKVTPGVKRCAGDDIGAVNAPKKKKCAKDKTHDLSIN